ncbi:hypothetical protein SOVF_012940 [Spinacia oleracea]|nr:hypothetical protein SOVF_012940 [Spinacia oleracea]
MPVQDVATYLAEPPPLPPPPSSDHFTTPPSWPSSDLHQHRRLDNTNVGATRFEDVEGVQISSTAPILHQVSPTTRAAGASENNNNGRLLFLSNNKDRVGRWCDGDKAIPLKKRRGFGFGFGFGFNNTTFAENSSTIITTDEDGDDTTTTSTITEMIIMKCNDINDDADEKQDAVVVAPPPPPGPAAAAAASVKKGNGKRGNTILEGSRCSRVNGRGWRCCQPTLVGYSLCEHHLGKGRLRSMSSASAKSRSSKNKKKSHSTTTEFAIGRDEERSHHTVDDVREKKKLERMNSFGNKRVKLGVVKARSLSSLLGQTNNHASMQQHENISNLDYQ